MEAKKQAHVMNSLKMQNSEEKDKGSRSVFYTNDNSEDTTSTASNKAMRKCLQDLKAYLEILQKASGAGTCLAQQFDSLLKDTPYSEIAGQFYSGMKDIEEQTKARQSQAIVETEGDIECLPETQEGCEENSEDITHDNFSEVGGKCFLRLLQAQYVFFQTSLAKLTLFDNTQMSEDLKCQNVNNARTTSNVQSPTDKGLPPQKMGKEKTQGTNNVDSPKRFRKQISSFFSKLGQKSQSATQSSFYVDIAKEGGGGQNLLEDVQNENESLTFPEPSAGQRAGPNLTKDNVDTTLTNQDINRQPFNSYSALGPIAKPIEKEKIEVTTQEELDMVIDMLSRSHVRPMEAIPENPVPEPLPGPASKAVGSHLGPQHPKVFNAPPGPAGPHLHEERVPRQQPRHDVSRELDSFPRETKTNTWPFRPHQRGLQSEDISQLMQMYGAYGYMPGGDLDQSNTYLMGGRQQRLSTGAAPFMSAANNNLWSMHDPGTTQREWPAYIQGHTDYEQPSRHWSTGPDSSSCSDESSSNGEMWMMGLNVPPVMNGKRRHSSGEEVMSVSTVSNTTLNKSVESLTDPKTKTWPPKHPWGNRPEEQGMGETIPSSPGLPPHRPLSAQWSDPLNPKGLSVWDPGNMPGHFPGLPVAGHQNRHSLMLDMDKKF